MNRGISAVATSMLNGEQWLDVVANNLANVSTAGFKRDGVTFKATLTQQLAADGGAGSMIGSIGQAPGAPTVYGTLAEPGPLNQTGNPLDVALQDDPPTGPDASPNSPQTVSMFAVQVNGQTLYTRDGSFQLSADGELVTASGYPVLDSSGNTISIPSGQFSISSTGAISAPDKTGTKTVAQLGAFSGTPADFKKAGDNLYIGSPQVQANAGAHFVSGALEGSNVNPVEAMVDMIRLSRSYELQQKTITQQDSLTQKLIASMG